MAGDALVGGALAGEAVGVPVLWAGPAVAAAARPAAAVAASPMPRWLAINLSWSPVGAAAVGAAVATWAGAQVGAARRVGVAAGVTVARVGVVVGVMALRVGAVVMDGPPVTAADIPRAMALPTRIGVA